MKLVDNKKSKGAQMTHTEAKNQKRERERERERERKKKVNYLPQTYTTVTQNFKHVVLDLFKMHSNQTTFKPH